MPHSPFIACILPKRFCVLCLAVVASTFPTLCAYSEEAAHAENEVLESSWKTRTHARVYEFSIPAPRGQITDRHGVPLANNRLGYNLELKFPIDSNFSDKEAVFFAKRWLMQVKNLLGKEVNLSDDIITQHYHNRKRMPLLLLQDVPKEKLDSLPKEYAPYLNALPVYYRYYPQGSLASHIIGYVSGARGRILTEPEPQEPLWSQPEGREGLEQYFNDQLAGIDGTLKITTDEEGKITSEGITTLPYPGFNVVTTLDIEIQKICESVLSKNAKRGAIVIVSPKSGDILAMASWPTYDPNLFVPNISVEDFDALNNNSNLPLFPRAYRSAYPPGSTFKIITGIAALDSGKISSGSYFPCPAYYTVGNATFRNHKKSHQGSMNFRKALAQSCNTWFYHVGILTGGKRIIDWATRMGLGYKSGIPLAGEASGNVPTNEYMLKHHGRKILDGDVANLSIGQGDLLVTPLQMAQAMGGVANGGTMYQARLVSQIQTINDAVEIPYPPRERSVLGLGHKTVKEIRAAMEGVVSSAGGTGRKAQVKGLQVAGKTGTAQWKPAKKQVVAWFCGFAPADEPRYAFSVLYEASPGEKAQGGRDAAPLISQVLTKILELEKQVSPPQVVAQAETQEEGNPAALPEKVIPIEEAKNLEIRPAIPLSNR